jgi:sugar lactone lactonase YvrE
MSLKRSAILISLLCLLAVTTLGIVIVAKRRGRQSATELSQVRTLAGAPASQPSLAFSEPFGVAVDANDTTYFTDGETGKVWRLTKNGNVNEVTSGLLTPSAIAAAPDGTLIVAETGANVIRRIFPEDGRQEVVAGEPGRAGFADGVGGQALFNGPIGVAVGADGTIFVADTYNDRIRSIDASGRVSTLAGTGEPGDADSSVGSEANFYTPCGIAVAPDGALIVADTGNNRIRRVDRTGAVRTIAGNGDRGVVDGMLFAASFNQPTGVAVGSDGSIYVADSGGAALRFVGWDVLPRVRTLAGETDAGSRKSPLPNAQMNRPSGVALASDGALIFADSGNRLIRALVDSESERGVALSPADLASGNTYDVRANRVARWPYDPPDRKREIAATFGEIRGEITEDDKEAWFHNGLDIPGAYGESARLLRGELIQRPISVDDVGKARERIRFPLFGYVHIRVGRNQDDKAFDDQRFVINRDREGKVSHVRVRRGARFEAGDVIGTLNNQNHVHLIVGRGRAELNPFSALDLPGVQDSVAPVIEKDGVSFFDAGWRQLSGGDSSGRIKLAGDVRIVVRSYDQMDGNASRRRLGLYRVGYQLLNSDGSPADGFAEPVVTISFETLPLDEDSAQTAYAAGSRSGATGETVFAYIVTNVVRDGVAKEGFLSLAKVPAGDYIVRIIAEDFFGNRTVRDTAVIVASG